MPELKNVRRLTALDSDHTFLVLISPEKIPHLVIVHANRYYSLTYRSSVIGGDFDAYLEFLRRARKKLLFVDLGVMSEDPSPFFSVYESADETSITCLQPVRDYLAPKSMAQFVYELLPELDMLGKVLGYYQLNLDNELDDSGNFEMTIYSRKLIYSYIQQLNERNVQRQANIPENS